MLCTREVTVQVPDGLHHQTAARFIQTANRFTSVVRVVYGDNNVNAKSLLGVLSLSIGAGTRITITADGADAGELLSAFAFDAHSLEKILEDVAQRVKETGESVFSAVTESVSHSIAYGIVYAAAFIAILLVVWLLLKPLDLAGKLPLVRTVNALGGALLGFIWAVLLLFAAVWLMQRFNWVVTPELIRDSILLKFFAENNPIGLIAAL